MLTLVLFSSACKSTIPEYLQLSNIWIDLSKWTKSCVNNQQKVSSEEEEFNNQVDIINFSVASQPSSLLIPAISQWDNQQSGCGGREGGHVLIHQHGLPLSKADLAKTAAVYQI